jgi:tetratricopeptide (TPR) repeat protein
MALAPNRVEGRLARGDYYRYVTQDPRQAQEQYAEGQRIAPNNADLLTGGSLAQEGLGRWEEALENLRKALALDPRSTNTARRLAFTLLWLRRYPDADAAYDRALGLGPTNLQAIEGKAMVQLAQGNLDGARAVLRSVPQEVEPTALVAYVSTYWDLFWMLEPEQQGLLLRLTPTAFDDDHATWAIVLAQAYHLRGDTTRTRVYADSALPAFESRVRAGPNDPQNHAFLGLTLAYLGRKAEAVREGEKAVAIRSSAGDGYNGPYYQHLLARTYTLLGEPEKALNQLEGLLKIPYFLSPGWLKVDPTFDPLRKNPRFEKMVKGDK